MWILKSWYNFLMPLFQKKQRGGQHFIIIFDIGSASIGGSFVSINPGKIPEVIFSIRRDIPFQEKLNFERFLNSMISTLEDMFEAMKKAGGGVVVDQAYCVLASPWYASQTRLVRYTQSTPFLVTKKGLDKLIQKEVGIFTSSAEFEKAKSGGLPPVIMESKNIQIKLNGYEVRNPFEKNAAELEVALYISMIPSNIFTSINESILKFWHLRSVHFSSFSFTAFDTIRDIFVDESSFLFMDISGEVTDISLAKDNVLLESISFPAGKNMLLRSLIKEMKSSPSTATSELKLYHEGNSTHEHAKQIEQILSTQTDQWKIFFEDALAQFATEYPIPKTIYYTADDDVTKWFASAIKEANFKRFAQEDGQFFVRELGNTFLNKFIQVQEPDFQDPFLAIESIFANKISSLLK